MPLSKIIPFHLEQKEGQFIDCVGGPNETICTKLFKNKVCAANNHVDKFRTKSAGFQGFKVYVRLFCNGETTNVCMHLRRVIISIPMYMSCISSHGGHGKLLC